jgi:RNA-directed DNA polymerase
MPACADKWVQRACAKLLRAIDAQDLLECSDGSRLGRGALEAVRDRTFDLPDGPYGAQVEADGQGVFDQWDHPRLLTRRRERMDDRACLRLMRKWLQAGILETDGHIVPPETGSPQGGSISPVLAKG